MTKLYASLLSDTRTTIKMFLNLSDYFVNWEDLKKRKTGEHFRSVTEGKHLPRPGEDWCKQKAFYPTLCPKTGHFEESTGLKLSLLSCGIESSYR